MKLIVLLIFAITAVLAEEDYNAPEWQPIDWSKVIPANEAPGFWENTIFAKIIPKRRPNSRIVGGTEATRNGYPYQVALLLQDASATYLCGGSVIRSNVILTAAHCPTGRSTTTVIAGAHDRTVPESTQQHRTVYSSQYRIHSQYNSYNLNNDIATLILSTSLVLNSYVAVIPLADSSAGTFNGYTGQVTGWGRTEAGLAGTTSPVLRVVTNPIISNDVCAQTYGTAVVNSAVICMATTGGRGTCGGDSGGVLSASVSGSRIQVGIVSFSHIDGCAIGYPHGFERVSAHYSWINNNLN